MLSLEMDCNLAASTLILRQFLNFKYWYDCPAFMPRICYWTRFTLWNYLHFVSFVKTILFTVYFPLWHLSHHDFHTTEKGVVSLLLAPMENLAHRVSTLEIRSTQRKRRRRGKREWTRVMERFKCGQILQVHNFSPVSCVEAAWVGSKLSLQTRFVSLRACWEAFHMRQISRRVSFLLCFLRKG